jgi:hypothetical protein
VVSLPRYIVAQGEQQPGLRVLWLRPGGDRLRYTVTPMSGGFIGADQLAGSAVVRRRLDSLVAGLATPSGSDAAQALSTHAVRFVALSAPADPALAAVLDAQPALTRERSEADSGLQLWRVIAPTSRVMLLSGAAAQEAQATRGPSLAALRENPPEPLLPDPKTGKYVVTPGPADRLLVVSEYAGGPWRIRGGGLEPVTAWGWARAAVVPAEGTTVTIAADGKNRRTSLALQGFALFVALILAAPGVRRSDEEPAIVEPVDEGPAAPVGDPVGASA